MSFPVRSLTDISKTVRGAFRQYLPGTDASLKQNVLYVIAKVVTLLGREYELRFAWLAKQMFLSSATDPQWVARHAADVGIYQKPAAGSTGTITGTGLPGTAYSAGIRFVSGAHSWLTGAATANGGGVVTFPVTCEQAGAATNRDEGAVLNLADPLLNPSLSQQFEVTAAGLGGGADAEQWTSLRDRALFRKRNPRRAGALSDYEEIARAVPGVTRAWAFRVPNAPGAVLVLFLFDGRTDGIPETGDVAAVQAAIDAARLIRVDAGEAAAPVALPIDIEIENLASDTAEVRAAIEAAVRAMFLTRCRPGLAGNTFTVSRSWIAEAISTAVGEESHKLSLPADDIVLTGGEFPVLGTVDYA